MSAVYVGAAVGGAVVGGLFSNHAANTQAGAAADASNAQLNMFGQTQKNLDPYMKAGEGAVSQLVQGTQPGGALMPQSYTPYDMNTFMNSPEYKLMMQQQEAGLNASQNASSLTGGANSNNMKSLINWTQGNTMGAYGSGLNDYIQQFMTGNQAKAQQYNTLSGVASSGQNAAAGMGGFATQVGGQIGGNIIGAGNAQAAGTVGVGNAITGSANQGYQAWLQQQYMSQNNPNAMNVNSTDPANSMNVVP
jgi:hypothetical protein